MTRPSPWCSASRPPATRPASASSAATRCWPTRSPPASRSTPASAAWCPRSPAAPTSRRWCPTIERACETAGITLHDVDAIAVTSPAPASPARCWSGSPRAKALALGLGKPIYGVNHLAAHVAVDQLEHGPLPEPCLAMLVSGGHSSLLRVERRHRRRRPARRDHRRRGGRGLRQGRPAARAAVPRRPATSTGPPRAATASRSTSRAG